MARPEYGWGVESELSGDESGLFGRVGEEIEQKAGKVAKGEEEVRSRSLGCRCGQSGVDSPLIALGLGLEFLACPTHPGL